MVNSYYTSVKETFPSPTGDLYFSIFIGVVTIVGTSFRPLPGTYISQYFYLAANRGVFSVSVPYRGLIFLNKLFIVSRLLIMVSVPYRGLIFLNRIWCVIPESAKGFRPLPGTYISQYCNVLSTPSLVCFRPLPGTYISQWSRVCCQKWHKRTVSVPYRGLIFLNTISAIPCKHWLYYAICVGNDFSEI